VGIKKNSKHLCGCLQRSWGPQKHVWKLLQKHPCPKLGPRGHNGPPRGDLKNSKNLPDLLQRTWGPEEHVRNILQKRPRPTARPQCRNGAACGDKKKLQKTTWHLPHVSGTLLENRMVHVLLANNGLCEVLAWASPRRPQSPWSLRGPRL
jgi:hypothetical protein